MPSWFVVRDGAEQGPLSSEQLRNLVIAGQVRPDDLVRREDIPKPLRAGAVKGLFDAKAGGERKPSDQQTSQAAPPPGQVPPVQTPGVEVGFSQAAKRLHGPRKRRLFSPKRMVIGITAISGLLLLWLVVKPLAGTLISSVQATKASASASQTNANPAPVVVDPPSDGASSVPTDSEESHQGEQPANAAKSEGEPENSSTPSLPSKDPLREVIEWTDENGSVVLFSDKLIPILYGVPKSVLKQMPAEQLALFGEMEKLAEEANRAAEEQGSNPVLRGRLTETILKKAAALTAEQDDIRYRNLPQENPLRGWVGRIHLASGEAVVLIGRKSSINNEGLYYQLSLRRKNPPRTTYLASDHEAIVWIHIETDAMSDAAIAQFKSLKNGDWVKVDLPDAGWESVQLVGFGEKDDALRPVYGGLSIRERYAVRNRTKEPVIRKLVVSD